MTPLFEQIFEHSPIAMILVRAGGNIALVNRHAERLFQYDRAELIDQQIETLVPEGVRARHPALVKEYVNAPLPRQMGTGRDLFAVRQDGSLFPVEVGLNPIEIDGVFYVLASVIDITERQRAEELVRAAVEAAPNGMIMIDSERRIQLINEKAEQIFGFSREELVGNSIEMLVPEDFKEHHPRFVESYLGRPESRAMGIGRELFGRHKSGRLIPVEIALQPIVSSGQTFVISSVVDITYRKNAEAEIRRKTEEIEEFSYRTSHDLRSPLKSIAGMSECVRENLDEGDLDSARANIDRITGLTGSLLKMIEDILRLTQVDASQEDASVFDFEAFEALCRDKFDAALAAGAVDLQFTLLHKCALTVEPARLTQVLDNLIGNAIKYADESRAQRVVRVLTFTNRSTFFIHVEDNGIGIPEDHQAEVFGMFKRFHSASISGSGLGLHLVRKQIARLGAGITFESGPDGTSFYIAFPRHDREPRA